jgi:hypothetical protein
MNTVLNNVSAQGSTIIIRPDGSVGSSNGIQREGNTYTLTTDLKSPIEIQKSNIILDGANYTLQGSGETNNLAAIVLKASNITVTNFHISNWTAGISGMYDNNIITANEVTNTNRAIALYATDYIINKNIIQRNVQGIYIKDVLPSTGGNNLVIGNQIVNNDYAFNILSSNGTTITQNNIADNRLILNIIGGPNYNFSDVGDHLFYSNVFVNNKQVLNISFNYLLEHGYKQVSPAGNWDNGTIGNYWSDYTTRYPNASEIANSIWNTTYLIEDKQGTNSAGIAFDHYPLIYEDDIFANDMSVSSNDIPIKYVAVVILVLVIVITLLIAITYRKKTPPIKR